MSAEPAPPAVEPAVDPVEVDALLDAVVARLGGQRRAGQVEMARVVADGLASGQHVVVQAGTGTGKSLGYLVPAVRHAVEADERVVVSTATLALQRQILTRDLPLVADVVGPRLDREPRVALLKGWHNYVCVHKVAGGYPQDEPGLFDLSAVGGEAPGAADHPAPTSDLAEQVLRARRWAEETDTGDRDDLVPGVGDRAWRQVSVTSLECLGQKCPMIADCFPEAARRRAREADVVVTNHAMLGIAATGGSGVLPEHQVLIVDEAHELADRVTAQATAELSVTTIEQAARAVRRHAGLPTADLDSAATALATVLVDLPAQRFRDGLPEAVATAVAAVRDEARALLSTLRAESGDAAGGEAEAGRAVATSAVVALFEVAERMVAEPDAERPQVLWSSRPETDGWARSGRLHTAPLDVAGLIRSGLLAGRTAVLTSATLALGGSFTPFAAAIGLGPGHAVGALRDGAPPVGGGADGEGSTTAGGDAPHPRWRGIDVGSPFDYRKQGILYVAQHLPAPGRDGPSAELLDELTDLVAAAGGRTLGLFSSRRAAVEAAEVLRERLGLPILCQGEDQLPTLVQRFAADEQTSLFGTLSLWQGVDVPGRTCTLVTIDRLPFPRPDDPITAARAEAVARAGGNGFMSVAAVHAALRLAQGTGRLIRTGTDRGVVAVLDPRLRTARYGTFLTRSLPPLWPTTDPAVVRAALARLADQAGAPVPGAPEEGSVPEP